MDVTFKTNTNQFSSELEPLHDAILDIREIPNTEGFYNAAAWEGKREGIDEGKIYLLGRRGVAGELGEPDPCTLVLMTLDPEGNFESSKEVWRPRSDGHLLEDARALSLPDGRIAFGLTSVVRKGNDYIPHPSVLIVKSPEELAEGLSKLKIIKFLGGVAIGKTSSYERFTEKFAGVISPGLEVIGDMVGDQTTPLGEDISISPGKNVTAIGPDLFAFRQEGDENNHRLRIFKHLEDCTVIDSQYIDFPKDIPWIEHRIGTTMPPIWLNENEAIFPIHGIQRVDGKFVYSIGSARLLRGEDGKLSVDNISQEPIINPNSFAGRFNGDDVELHGERRVVYCCGGIPIYNDSGELERLKLYVNVGDKRTVEVTMSVAEMIKHWRKSELVEQTLPVAV
jgi:hypothetical protein